MGKDRERMWLGRSARAHPYVCAIRIRPPFSWLVIGSIDHKGFEPWISWVTFPPPTFFFFFN